MKNTAELTISARESNGFLFEKYEYSPGRIEPLPPHTHAEYQFSISPNSVGEYLCRGGKFAFGPRTLGIIHSGERHAPSDKLAVENAESYRVMYVSPEEVLSLAQEIGWKKYELPYFKNFLLTDKLLVAKYWSLFDDEGETRLSEDVKKLEFLTYLIKNFAQKRVADKEERRNPKCVGLTREYLNANFARSVSLDELSKIA